MRTHVSVNFDGGLEDLSEDVQNAMALIGLARSLCEMAKKLGITREGLIERIPVVIDELWNDPLDESDEPAA